MSEQWYAIYDEKTGELVSTGTVVADDKHLKANGLKKKKIDKQPDEKHVWHPGEQKLVAAPLPEVDDRASLHAQLDDVLARLRALDG